MSLGLLSASVVRADTLLSGDVDGDGRVTPADAILVLRASADLIRLTPIQARVADVNDDGKISSADAILILKAAAGLIPHLPVFPSPDSKIQIQVLDNQTVFEWPKTGKTIASLAFTQNGQTQQMLKNIEADGDQDRITLTEYINHPITPDKIGNDYALFSAFQPDAPVRVDVQVVDSSTIPPISVGSCTFTPIVHAYDAGVYGVPVTEITLDHPFSSTGKSGDTVTLSGQVLTPNGLQAVAYITVPPRGQPMPIGLQSSSPIDKGLPYGPRIDAGNHYQYSVTLGQTGTYSIEINDYRGVAALNQPVYVGYGFPLIPNPLDFQALPSTTPLDLPALEQEWLDLINQERALFNLPAVVLDADLSAAAQGHTDDMVKNNYLSHTGLDGSTPDSRAMAAGVPQTEVIGENLSQGLSIEELHFGLLASASHLTNILDSNWKRVGLGVSRSSDGLFDGEEDFGVNAGEYQLPTTYFDHLVLDQPLPTRFGFTPYVVSGTATNGTTNIVVFFQNAATGEQIQFPEDGPLILDSTGRFSLPIVFTPEDEGIYQVGISVNVTPGGANTSNAAFIIVAPSTK